MIIQGAENTEAERGDSDVDCTQILLRPVADWGINNVVDPILSKLSLYSKGL